MAKDLGLERPYLLSDVEPRVRSCELVCRLYRDRLATRAKEAWASDTAGGEELLSLPPLLDSANARLTLGLAQHADPRCEAIIWQKRKELDPKMPAKKGLKPGAASTLGSVEALEYRLAPEDELLERKVLLASCCLWVPVLPDSSVPGEPSGVSWRRWLFDYCHATFLNPHRPAGESFQMLRRSGYWDSLTVDFNRWYSECEVCHRHRAKRPHTLEDVIAVESADAMEMGI